MPQPVVHFEIAGADGERLRTFYRELFGWRPEPGGPGYWLVGAEDGGIGGGLMETANAMPNYVTVYVQVADLQASIARATELGGTVVVRPTVIPGVGRFAMFNDPEGNLIGMIADE